METSADAPKISHQNSSHKKHESHSNDGHSVHEEEGEPWLLSYADMVTLLMCFFILFFTLDKSKGGISDPERVKKKLEKMMAVDAQLLIPPAVVDASSSPGTSSAQLVQDEQKISKLKEQFTEDLRVLSKKLKVVFSLANSAPAVLELTFLNFNFFAPGSEVLTNEGKQMLEKANIKLKSLGKNALIEIEGHTDSDPIRNEKFSSNWDLSTARASSVAKFLTSQGLNPERLKISGYGPYRPIAKEKDSQGIDDPGAKKLNRRVILRIMLNPQSK